ncbi:hypothetical protein R1flu_018150 [Riccia fluitans]|uniref:RING-type domain-containing protein n=1 Tax=Riccia fluitans TaxID=41844 RepID=A0ABD1ZF76_9MARC
MRSFESKLKKLFTFDFKGLAICSSSGSSTVTDEELKFDNKENLPPIQPPFQGDVFELPSSDMENDIIIDDDESEFELPPEGVAQLWEQLEEEMIRFRTQFQRLGEGFGHLFKESFKNMMDAAISEYEAKFGETVRAGVKAQVRCIFLEDEVRKTKERLFDCERKLAAEKGNVLELKNLMEYVNASLVQELEKQTCRKCKINLRNTVILPCMHFLHCSECLHEHQRRSTDCPTCQIPIGAAVNLNLKVY